MKNSFQFLILFLFVNLISNIILADFVLAKDGAGVVAPGCNQPGMCPTKASVPCKLSGPCKTAAHQVISGLPGTASNESPKNKNNSGKPATK